VEEPTREEARQGFHHQKNQEEDHLQSWVVELDQSAMLDRFESLRVVLRKKDHCH
jgi:hypothetical protein